MHLCGKEQLIFQQSKKSEKEDGDGQVTQSHIEKTKQQTELDALWAWKRQDARRGGRPENTWRRQKIKKSVANKEELERARSREDSKKRWEVMEIAS